MSDIKIELTAQLSSSSIAEMKEQLDSLGNNSKLKVGVDGKALSDNVKKSWDEGKKKVEGDKIKPQVDTASFNKNLGDATTKMQGLYDKSNLTQVKMKDMGDGMYKVTANIKEADGSIKTVVHSYDSANKSLEKQAISVSGIAKGIQETNQLTKLQADNLVKIIGHEDKIKKLKEESRHLDPKSEKYKEVTSELNRLEAVTEEWKKELASVKDTDFSNMNADLAKQKQAINEVVNMEKLHSNAIKENAKFDGDRAKERDAMNKSHAQALKENAKIDEQISKDKIQYEKDYDQAIKMNAKFDEDIQKKRERLAKQQSVNWQQVGSEVRGAGTEILKLSAPLVATSGIAIKSAMDYQSSFAGVRKTVNATEKEFTVLSDGIRNMSKELPQSASAIASVSESAGQLGGYTPFHYENNDLH